MKQIGFWDGTEPFKITGKVRLIELFAGIGSQAKALERLGVDFEHYRIAEWETNAFASYRAIHMNDDLTDYSNGVERTEIINELFRLGISSDGKSPMTFQQIARKPEKWQRTVYSNVKATHNLVSVCTCSGEDLGIVETDKYTYIMTYSFPCQDLSKAGKQAGMGKGTRSGLLWEVERLLNETDNLPQVLLMENVPDVIGTKFMPDFAKWFEYLESRGYKNYYQVLNAKDYGIPQNRERCFMVSLLGDYYYDFPEPIPLELRLKDMLEQEVDEKYYLSDKAVEKILHSDTTVQKDNLVVEPKLVGGVGEINFGTQYRQGNRVYDSEAIAMALMAQPVGNAGGYSYLYKVDEPRIAAIRGRNPNNPSDRTAGVHTQQTLEINQSGTSNTLTTVQKDNVVVEPFINVVGNYSPSGHDASRIVDGNGLAPTVKENHGTVTAVVEPLTYNEQNTRIRKLTPLECWRLMGFDDADHEKAVQAGVSNSQRYKQAGNSIVVNVLEAIFKEMF